MGLAVGIVAEGGAGVLERDGVARMSGGEGVASHDGVLHQVLAFLTARHGFLIVYSGLCATHFGKVGGCCRRQKCSELSQRGCE